MNRRLETGLTLVLTLAAVAMAVAFVWRQLGPTSATGRVRVEAPQEPELYPKWRDWLPIGNSIMGADSASVNLLVFTDFECPYCARFHETVLKKTMEEFGPSVGATIIPFPLKIHRFAEISAVAAECAAEQGRFAEYVDGLFLKQDSLGLKSWESFALEAGVAERDQFQACVDAQRPLGRVKAGRAVADSIGLQSTPTVFVNGWRLPAFGEDELSRAIEGVLNGERPNSEPK